jgi:hypothetical protein
MPAGCVLFWNPIGSEKRYRREAKLTSAAVASLKRDLRDLHVQTWAAGTCGLGRAVCLPGIGSMDAALRLARPSNILFSGGNGYFKVSGAKRIVSSGLTMLQW